MLNLMKLVKKSTPFKPYVAASKNIKEFSLRATLLGLGLGVLFGVGNAYLGLKIGTTISASVPAAVISMAILRMFARNVTILENNIVQTIAAVGEGVAAGVVFTVPALFFLGERPNPAYISMLAILGGILGVLFMIPMRRYIIVREHGILPFPEGTACAEILKAGVDKVRSAALAGWGLLIGSVYKLCMSGLFLWNETVSYVIPPLERTQFSIDCTPALLGVGFIIGPRISQAMVAGGALAWFGLIPLIKLFGQGLTTIAPATIPIAQMSAEAIWENYIRYIGAGAIAVGGIVSLIRIVPMLTHILKTSFSELIAGTMHMGHLPRTERDIPMTYLILGSLVTVLWLWLFPGPMNLLTIILLVILGFFFVAVTSITVGLVGSSSNPTSGMIITTLLITCLIFTSLDWTSRMYLIAAITMGSVASVAIALAGTTSQDLKTGFLLGGTPKSQQVAELLGLILPAAAIGITLYILDKAYTLGSPTMPAPQATLMSMIAQGVIDHNLPFILVLIGIMIGIAVELARVPILPFAIGFYLPLSLSTATYVGGLVHAVVKRKKMAAGIQQGTIMASGLVAGDACMGVLIALFAVLGIIPATAEGFFNQVVSLVLFLSAGLTLGYFACKKSM